MAYGFLLRIVWAMGLVLLQALVFNHIHLWGYATPVVCAYVLCLQPLRQSRSLWLLGLLHRIGVRPFLTDARSRGCFHDAGRLLRSAIAPSVCPQG